MAMALFFLIFPVVIVPLGLGLLVLRYIEDVLESGRPS